MTEFESMNLRPELLSALKKINFEKPTEVQERAIPEVLSGKDVVVRSKTGSGKTGAFLIPIVQNLGREDYLSAIVIVPTRELALQVTTVAKQLSSDAGLRVATVYGGASIERQIHEIRRGVNIVIGTPGRLIDLIKRNELHLDRIKFLVLDEADIMLDMGFIDDITYIISKTSQNRQTMLFSATMPKEVVEIANKYMKNPLHLKIGEEEVVVSTITHYYAISDRSSKLATLLAYINEFKPQKAIIFSQTQRGAEMIYSVLKKNNFDAVLMHGGLSQSRREYSLSDFRKGTQFLIATNVAARGLDIRDVSDVINFDASEDPAVYVHRVGRSARMGANGRAFTIFIAKEKYLVWEIENMAKIKMEKIELDVEKYRTSAEPSPEDLHRRSQYGGGFGHRFSNRGGHGRSHGGNGHRFGRNRGFHGRHTGYGNKDNE